MMQKQPHSGIFASVSEDKIPRSGPSSKHTFGFLKPLSRLMGPHFPAPCPAPKYCKPEIPSPSDSRLQHGLEKATEQSAFAKVKSVEMGKNNMDPSSGRLS